MKESDTPVFHAIGNHDLYNFDPPNLRAQFNFKGGEQVEAIPHSTPNLRVPQQSIMYLRMQSINSETIGIESWDVMGVLIFRAGHQRQ